MLVMNLLDQPPDIDAKLTFWFQTSELTKENINSPRLGG